MDGTPIYDIKPYLPYADAHPDANGGYGEHATVRFTSGKTAKYGDTFANGKVNIGNIHVGYGVAGYTGEMMMDIQGENRAEQMAARDALKLMGIEE